MSGPYTLHGPDGDLGQRPDLHDALALARAICDRRQIWVDVRDERGLSLGVACPNNANATAIMIRARKRNHEVSMGRDTEPVVAKTSTLRTCDGQPHHDWIHFETAPSKLYRCRICDVIGYSLGVTIRPHACVECGSGATIGKKGRGKRPTWLCGEHAPR